MTFYKTSSYKPVAEIVAKKLINRLNLKEKVLWFVTGGSSIKAEVLTCERLKNLDLSNLAVILMDERFGEIGHKDSNWQQLLEAGFNVPGATLIPVLTGKDRHQTTSAFNANLKKYFDWADYTIGQFGIGPDGHTAGILPESPNINTRELATSYADSEAIQNFTEGVYREKDRITISAAAIAKFDEIIVIALGKKPSLFEQLEQDIPINKMPAQALKKVSNLSIYNDYKGESI